MRTSPDLLSWATTGTSPSGPNRTADNQLFSDTVEKLPAAPAIVKTRCQSLILLRFAPPPAPPPWSPPGDPLRPCLLPRSRPSPPGRCGDGSGPGQTVLDLRCGRPHLPGARASWPWWTRSETACVRLDGAGAGAPTTCTWPTPPPGPRKAGTGTDGSTICSPARCQDPHRRRPSLRPDPPVRSAPHGRAALPRPHPRIGPGSGRGAGRPPRGLRARGLGAGRRPPRSGEQRTFNVLAQRRPRSATSADDFVQVDGDRPLRRRPGGDLSGRCGADRAAGTPSPTSRTIGSLFDDHLHPDRRGGVRRRDRRERRRRGARAPHRPGDPAGRAAATGRSWSASSSRWISSRTWSARTTPRSSTA